MSEDGGVLSPLVTCSLEDEEGMRTELRQVTMHDESNKKDERSHNKKKKKKLLQKTI